MATLYVIATPIGNLEDITLRALRILKEVDMVLCEDTRVTKKLLSHYDIHTPTLSYHAHSTISKVEEIIAMLEEGKSLGLVSDAGTPAISDPGSHLVGIVREKLPQLKIESVPGPSALSAALSIAGIPVDEFTFLGFLPHKKGRETLFKQIAESARTSIFYESPYRIEKALESLHTFAPGKHVTVARELTKIFEQVVSGDPLEVANYFKTNEDKVRGEFVVLVSAKKDDSH